MALEGFQHFIGTWNVRRSIFDRLTSSSVSFSGQAEISADVFAEEGQSLMGTLSLPSRRSYHLARSADGVTVFFPDRRLFVEIGDSAAQTVFHQCGDDAYSGRFLFRSPDEWVETWQVRGPRKNYRSFAVYRRG